MNTTEPKPRRSFWWSLRGFFAALGALLTTGVAIVGLFLPDNHSTTQTLEVPPQNVATPTPTPTPTAMGGEIVKVQDTGRDPCCTFTVQVTLVGFNGQDCVLSSVLVNELDGSETPMPESVTFTSEADADRAGSDVDIPVAESGTYHVRFVLSDPDGVELDRSDSDSFDVS